ncbi:hypothetical protein ACFYZB_04160 [Streptomyces sp. NPDC001852]|uniref:hypothetical protein n=1 Tax=Streptomyces sp. NPDC001852 TaxID=3364619 RepID=UPI0036AC4334
MNHHTVMLIGVDEDLALLAVAAAQLVAEFRWRRRCTRAAPRRPWSSRIQTTGDVVPARHRNPMDRTSPEGTP